MRHPPTSTMRLRKLSMSLSRLEIRDQLDASLEQYVTPGDLASRWLFDIQSFGDLPRGCRVVDLGSGNGILGIGASILGASYVKFVETDKELCKLNRRNAESILKEGTFEVCNQRVGVDNLDISDYDLIISNPPWGRLKEGADSDFLHEISIFGACTHIMHSANAKHIGKRFKDLGWEVDKYAEADFPLTASYSHHKMNRGATRAGFWRLTPP